MALDIDSGNNRLGPLQENFGLQVPDGYSALVGANNSGKSAVLQPAFRTAYNVLGSGSTCLILPDRTQLLASTETGGRTLEAFNAEIINLLRGNETLSYETLPGPQRGELARLLLNHSDFERQLRDLQILLARLGLPRMLLRAAQTVHFEDVAGHFQGSGVRALLPILCGLTDDAQQVILIDEPEEALEPRLQKALRDLLIEKSEGRSILVSTHSHLFLNRRDATANLLVARQGRNVTVEPVTSDEELFDIAFNLLGSSTEDLFFPANYLLVEGASDQIVVERVLALLGVPHGRIKVVAAGGVDAVPDTTAALSRALLPVVMRDSPYAGRVVALIDAPADPNSHTVQELGRVLGDRLFISGEASLEASIPNAVYERAGLQRDQVLAEIEALRGDYRAEHEAKRRISREVARVLAAEDLAALPTVTAAVERALEDVQQPNEEELPESG